MLLYHSFPRFALSQYDEEHQHTLGIALLTGMIQHGLLMTPEYLTIRPHSNAPPEQQMIKRFRQTRACFTLVPREDLWTTYSIYNDDLDLHSHAQLFGPFSIGLNPKKARQLGAMPTFYFYKSPNQTIRNHPDEITASEEILTHLWELRTLMIALARIEARAVHEGVWSPGVEIYDLETLNRYGYTLEDASIVDGRIQAAGTGDIRATISLLEIDRPAAWNLVDWIGILLDIFQTADSREDQRILAYYQQREWRIGGAMTPRLGCHWLRWSRETKKLGWKYCQALQEIRNNLQTIDPEFFCDDYLDGSAMMAGTDHERFFEFVEELICPEGAKDRVMYLLNVAGYGGEFREVESGQKGFAVFSRES